MHVAFFENFAQLFKEAMEEWASATSIRFVIKDEFKTRSYTESFANLNINVDFSHSVYTIGLGTEIY